MPDPFLVTVVPSFTTDDLAAERLTPQRLLERVAAEGHEGLVAKRLDSPYLCRSKSHRRSSTGVLVLVDHPTENPRAKWSAARAVKIMRRCGVFLDVRRQLVAGLVRPVLVVVRLVDGEDLTCVSLSQDEDMVQNLAANAADDPFAVRVHPGSSRCSRNHAKFLCLKYGAARVAVFAVAVTQQKAQRFHARSELAGQVPRLLYRPAPCRMRGDAGDVQAPGAVFEERQCVQTCAEHGVDVEEVRRDDAFGLRGQKLPPGRAASPRCRLDARAAQDLPDRRGAQAMTEPNLWGAKTWLNMPDLRITLLQARTR